MNSRLKSFSIFHYMMMAAVIVVAIAFWMYYGKFSGNITGFFRIGSELGLSPYLIPEKIIIFQGEVGYDGQQFLSLALDPFLGNPNTLTALDHPAYRYRRIFYPFLSYCLAFGNRTLIPYMMVLINSLSIIGLVGFIGRFCRKAQIPVASCLFMLCIPGVWMVLSLSTADLLSSLLLVAAIYGFRHQKPHFTAIGLGLGCLTRETLFIAWVAILGLSLLEKRKSDIKWLLLAIIPSFLWNLYVIYLKIPGYTGVKSNFGFPFWGMLQKGLTLFSEISVNRLFEMYMWGLILSIFGAVLWLCWQFKRDNKVMRWIALFYGVMFVCSTIAILGYYLDYSRVYMDIYFLLLLCINYSRIPVKTVLMMASGVASVAFLVFHS